MVRVCEHRATANVPQLGSKARRGSSQIFTALLVVKNDAAVWLATHQGTLGPQAPACIGRPDCTPEWIKRQGLRAGSARGGFRA